MSKKVNKKNSKQTKTNSNSKAIIFMLVCFVLALVILFGGIKSMLKGTYSAGDKVEDVIAGAPINKIIIVLAVIAALALVAGGIVVVKKTK